MHGKRIRKAREAVERTKLYKLDEAVKLVKTTASAKFDETVELALNLGVDPKHADQMVRGVVNLPNGTGRTLRVAVFARGAKADEARAAGADVVGAEDLVAAVQGGKIDFDRCIATPDMMPLVGRLGKVLGPRGLMPNPKVGTVTMDVKAAVAASKGGAVEFRVEKAGIVQGSVGKASFGDDKLAENIRAFVDAVNRAKPAGAKGHYLQRAAISSTMGPGVQARPLDAADGGLGRGVRCRTGRQAPVSTGRAASAQTARPTDPNQSFVRTVESKFVHPHGLSSGIPRTSPAKAAAAPSTADKLADQLGIEKRFTDVAALLQRSGGRRRNNCDACALPHRLGRTGCSGWRLDTAPRPPGRDRPRRHDQGGEEADDHRRRVGGGQDPHQ